MITIDETALPMRKLQDLQTRKALTTICGQTEPIATLHETKRVVNILDAKYEKADLPKLISDNCTHLDSSKQKELLALLSNFNELFDGSLGDWKTEPVSLGLKEGATPFHGRPFPVPVIQRDILKMEVKRLVELGVLKWQGASEWTLPTFIIPKENGQV